ncbi:MAG: hypothetical protein ABL892_09085 [Thiobacillaceae bacterium]
MRKLFFFPLLTALAGCAPAYTVSQYRTDSANPALIELRARDAFRNSDRMTLSVETRVSCQQKPDLATVAELQSNRDLLLRDRSSYSAPGRVEPGKPTRLALWHVSSSGSVTTTCGNTGVWQFDPGKRYVLEVRNWSSQGGTGKELFGKFGCEWRMTEADTGHSVTEMAQAGSLMCGDRN